VDNPCPHRCIPGATSVDDERDPGNKLTDRTGLDACRVPPVVPPAVLAPAVPWLL